MVRRVEDEHWYRDTDGGKSAGGREAVLELRSGETFVGTKVQNRCFW